MRGIGTGLASGVVGRDMVFWGMGGWSKGWVGDADALEVLTEGGLFVGEVIRPARGFDAVGRLHTPNPL